MLLSSISSSLISSSTIISSSASSTAVSMITTPGLPHYGALIVAGLIALLSLKEVLSGSERWTKVLNNSFNMAIVPLLCCFAGIVVFKVATII